jgi:hypothetical protein
VPLIENLEVRFREENGTLVIQGRSGRGTFATAPAVLPGGEVGSFLYLTDTPAAYTSAAGKVVAVNATEDALEFVAGGAGGGNQFEWLFVGGGVIPPGGNYVGYNSWGALVIEPDSNYYQALTILNGVSDVFGLDSHYAYFSDFDNSTLGGTYLSLGRNNNGTTPAAGYLSLAMRTGAYRPIWIDASNQVRVMTDLTALSNTTDTGGVVVGTQSSSLATKDVLGDPVTPDEALLHVLAAAKDAVKRFRYKPALEGDESSRPFNGEEFSGIITDYAERYGMDRDEEHPAGKSLNVITAIGDLMLAVAELAKRVEELEAQISGG